MTETLVKTDTIGVPDVVEYLEGNTRKRFFRPEDFTGTCILARYAQDVLGLDKYIYTADDKLGDKLISRELDRVVQELEKESGFYSGARKALTGRQILDFIEGR